MSAVTLKFATCNVPESRKQGLIMPQSTRARLFVDWLNRAGIDLAVVQESGTYLQAEAMRRQRWQTVYAPRNDRVKGRDIGNGQIARRKLTEAANTFIASRRTGRGGPLHLSVVTWQIDGAEFVVIGLHRQTNSADPKQKSRKRMDAKLRRYSKRLHRKGVHHVIAGDINGNESWARQFPWLEVAAAHTPDIVLVSRSIQFADAQSHDVPRISDHEFVSVVLTIPTKE